MLTDQFGRALRGRAFYYLQINSAVLFEVVAHVDDTWRVVAHGGQYDKLLHRSGNRDCSL